jgi:ABC-type transport system substrate-binding protein
MKGTAGGRRLASGISLVLAASALTVAPAGATDDQSLVYAIMAEVTTLNNGAEDNPTDAVNQWLYNGLYARDESLSPVPDIAADYAEVSEDGKTWTVRLRDDVYFQPGGAQLTAEDVVFTYQLSNSENCRFAPHVCLAYVTVTPEGADEPVQVLQQVEALDDFTVRFTLADAYAPFGASTLTTRIESKAAILEAYAEFEEQSADVKGADVDALIASTADTDDPVAYRADMEALITSAGLELPDEARYIGDDGALDQTRYAGALRDALTDLSVILSAEEIDRIAAAYAYLDTGSAPVGTGPFYLTELRAGQDLTLTRNEQYHHGPASFEKIYVPIIKDDVAGAMALASGEIDWKRNLTADGYAQAKDAPGVKFASYPGFGYFALQFNLRPGRLFHEKAVRQALAYCFDKPATVAAATDGEGIPIYADIPPASWAYNADVPHYEYDIEKGMALLEEAGWVDTDGDGVREKDGRPLSSHILLRAGKPDRTKFMRLLTEQVRDCGFDLTQEEVDFSLMWVGLEWPLIMTGQDEQWDAYFGGWGGGYDPDPYSLWHSSNCVTEEKPDRYNYICFQDERADELIEAGVRELDQEARAAIYQEFEMIMAEELPYLWAWSDVSREGLRSDINGAQEWTEEVMSTPTWYWELEKIHKGGFPTLE